MLGPMRPPAEIKPWLSLPQLTEWVCATSADASLLRKRLVVWLMALQPSHAHQVAALLALIKAWLEVAVEEEDGRGKPRRTTVDKDSGRGTPQGGVITPRTQKITSSFGG